MAQTLYIFRQGESKRVLVELKDRTGADFPVNTATQIKAQLYIQGKPDVKVMFALAPESTDVALFINGTDNFIIELPIDREQSKLLDSGSLCVDVVVKKPNTDMIDGDGVTEFAPITLGTLEKGYGKDITI